MQQEGVNNPSTKAIKKAIAKEELYCHYYRRTREAELTLQLIEELLLQLSTATDSLAVYKYFPYGMKRRAISLAFRIHLGWPCTLSQDMSTRVAWSGATSVLLCKRNIHQH